MSSMTADITLFHWNILEISDDLAIFVGLYKKRDNPESDSTYHFSFRRSTKIIHFDELTGYGKTLSGRDYQCIGAASDPHGIIRAMVNKKMRGMPYHFRYPFLQPNG